MLQTGQPLRSRDPAVEARQRWPKAIVGYAVDYAPGHSTGRHSHGRAQLVHGEKGVMTVRTDDGAWVVPPGYAVWVRRAWSTRSARPGRWRCARST